jgi:hypothetical protein
MITKRVIGLVMLTLLIVSTAALAEDAGMNNFSVKAGAYFPSSSTTRDNLGSTWLDVALGYKLPISNRAAEQEIAVGYIKAPGRTIGGVDTDAWMIPVTYTYKARPTGNEKLYVGAGGGAYFSKVKGLNGSGVVTSGASDSSTKFGLSALAGYNLSKSLSAEVGYTGIFGKLQNQNLGGFTVAVRAKF